MSEDWVGNRVSLDCGPLGHFQVILHANKRLFLPGMRIRIFFPGSGSGSAEIKNRIRRFEEKNIYIKLDYVNKIKNLKKKVYLAK